jgi:CRP-like cAMP-binding protein
MTSKIETGPRNLLLAFLSDGDFDLLEPHLEPVVFNRGVVLARPNDPPDHVWFPESGIISQFAATTASRRLEVGMFGRDGFGPFGTVLGCDRSPLELLIQVEGHGNRIEAKVFTSILNQCLELRAVLLRFVQTFTVQSGYTALANGCGHVGERLARLLLMYHDRIDGDALALTHASLATTLGVRRAGITDAMHLLESVNIVRATRGSIRILDRKKLERTAGGTYGIAEDEYKRLIMPLRTR